MNYLRDYSTMIAFFGFFSMAWFGWAQEKPPPSWRKYIGGMTALSMATFLYGIYLSYTNWDEATALAETGAMTYYFIFVALEFAIAIIGAVILFRRDMKNYVAPWVCVIVGVHFFPLRYVFADASLYILGVLLLAVAAGSIYLYRQRKTVMSATTGIGAGISLLIFAGFNVLRLI